MKKMNLIVQHCCECEEFSILKDADKNTVILSGDEYHDKIDSKIDGFLEACNYLNVEYNLEYMSIGCDEHE